MIRDIRTLRQEKSMTLKELSIKTGVSQRELSKCERGLILPNAIFFGSIAKELGVSPSALYEYHKSIHEQTVSVGEGYITAKPKKKFQILPKTSISEDLIPVMDLLCGTGGFSHGFEQTGKYQVIFGLDLLEDRIKTFSKNHKRSVAYCQDITTIDPIKIKEACPIIPDIIIAGPPCQGFSSIRPFRMLTETDFRNNLYEYCAAVLSEVEPSWFVMENVVGLLTHRNGETLRNIIHRLEELGYEVKWKILNAALYGLPQRRERLIIVANRLGIDYKWSEPTHYLKNNKSMAGKKLGQFTEQTTLTKSNLKPAVTVMEAIHDLPPVGAGEEANYYLDIELTEYEKMLRKDETKLNLHKATNHSPKMLEIIRHAGSNINSLPEGMVTSGFSTCYSRLEPNEPSVTITVNFVHPSSNKCIHPFQDRALTPREGARLQGFEDSYEFVGTRSQIIKQIGNAVPPLLGKIIGESIYQYYCKKCC